MKFDPHDYQRYCIQRILEQSNLALWLDMGLGKTVITLTAIAELKYGRFAISKALVVAPKKVAEATWQKEADKWDHLRMLRISTMLGSAQRRTPALAAAERAGGRRQKARGGGRRGAGHLRRLPDARRAPRRPRRGRARRDALRPRPAARPDGVRQRKDPYPCDGPL